VIYARDELATRARIEALEGLNEPFPSEFDDERDPEWAVYLDQVLRR
jgi:hypothetical protein